MSNSRLFNAQHAERDPNNIRVTFKGPLKKGQIPAGSWCQVTISVGQNPHHDDYAKVVAIIMKIFANQAKVVLMLDDNLQKYTLLMHDLAKLKPIQDLEQYEIEAIEAGDKWLKSYYEWLDNHRSVLSQDVLQAFNDQEVFKIVRWKDWDREGKEEAIKYMHEYVSQKATLRTAINDTIMEYMTRLKKKHEFIDKQQLQPWGYKYVVEEIAGMIFFWEAWKCKYEMYPGPRTKAMAEAHAIFIEQGLLSEDLLQPICVVFRNRGDVQNNMLNLTNLSKPQAIG